jgi:hypothetical protein
MAAGQHIKRCARDHRATEAWVRCQANPCEICGEESSTATGFDPTTSVFQSHCHSTSAPHSSTRVPQTMYTYNCSRWNIKHI